MCSIPCESEVTCFRPESNWGPYGLLNFLSAALSTTELWWRINHQKSFRTLNLSYWDKQLRQAQPVPVGQADWDRLCLSQWDRQAVCTKPVPLGLGKVKRNLSLSYGTSHISTLEAFSCPGQALYPWWSLSQFHLSQLVPQSGSTRPWTFVEEFSLSLQVHSERTP